jgi:hypothetical protein
MRPLNVFLDPWPLLRWCAVLTAIGIIVSIAYLP